MRGGSVSLVLLAIACSRANPSFDEGGDPSGASASGTTSLDRTTGPDPTDRTTTDATSTAGHGSGIEPDTTSGAEATTTGVEGSTSIQVGSTGDCTELVTVKVEPSADAFVKSGLVACGGLSCAPLNFGGSPEGVVQDVGSEFRSYMIVSFDLSEAALPQPPLSATLTVHVGHEGEVAIQAGQVRPLAWNEGEGFGTPALPGESAWNWSASPTAWSTSVGTGTFDVVLDGAAGLTVVNVAAAIGSHPVDIPLEDNALDASLSGSSSIDLVVTKVSGAGEAIVFSRESAVQPVLSITGC